MTLIPARYNFTAWENTTFRKTITILTGSPGSTPRNLSGYTAHMDIRTAPDTTPVYSLSTSTGGITLGGAQGTIQLYISATDTGSFDVWGDSGIYELVIIDTGGSGDSDALLWGNFRVRGTS